jgi:hypothetical protein
MLCRPQICVDLKIVVALIDALRLAANLFRPGNKAKVTTSEHTLCYDPALRLLASLQEYSQQDRARHVHQRLFA